MLCLSDSDFFGQTVYNKNNVGVKKCCCADFSFISLDYQFKVFLPIFFTQVGLGADKIVNKDENVVNDAKPGDEKPVNIKPIAAVANEGAAKTEEPVKAVEGEVKRQEPPVPHAPQDNSPGQTQGEEEHLKNEKRQLMSKGEDEKSTSSDRYEKLNGVAGNAVGPINMKVSEHEIDEELRKLEQKDKVS